ncbi:protein lethal(2)essential for life-like [Trichoplusia ni]|uniref:Protein lethal(2)essential for life-like n=1 Tax=Trichoplusia ni TaxID=7111 RepID=A0A7E5VZV9_TRINI|nr:protein lethal(2)essential for life-like [Trichoplusia ni]
MLQLPTIKPPLFGDDSFLRSIEWLESFPMKHENSVKKEEDRFEIHLQVKDYAPEEISVKTADGFVVVEGKHEEKQDDYGYIARQFIRRFQIPEGCRIEEVKSRLTGDGQLIITIPRLKVIKKDIVIPVTHETSKSKSKL